VKSYRSQCEVNVFDMMGRNLDKECAYRLNRQGRVALYISVSGEVDVKLWINVKETLDEVIYGVSA
jgi:hypothetical protein